MPMPILLLFLLFRLSTATATATTTATPPSEISALKSFISSINPTTIPSYSCLASWNFTTDPCSTPYITHFVCAISCSNSRVSQLTLDPAGYSGTLSPLISQLTQLTHLDLSENNFSGPIPSSLSSLINLQTLTLRFNSFSGSVPPSFSSFKSLQSLDLSHNLVSGTLPNTLSSLASLSRLDVSFNKLTGSIPKLPPNLLQLALKSNSLSGYLTESTFNESTRLETLELSENLIAGVLQPWFFRLPSLQQVNLSKNKLTRIVVSKPPNGLDNNLVAVDLSYNKLQGNLPINFIYYNLLSSLALSYNRLRGPIPLEYSQMETLRRLFVDGNYLNGSPPKEFFSGEKAVSGSLGDNCLQSCPVSSQLCMKSQKAPWVCRQAYGKTRRLLVSL